MDRTLRHQLKGFGRIEANPPSPVGLVSAQFYRGSFGGRSEFDCIFSFSISMQIFDNI